MAVQPDQVERAGPAQEALEALAEAGHAAARGRSLADVLDAVADAALRACAADAAVVRVLDVERGDLVVRAAHARSDAAVLDLRGSRLPLDSLPDAEAVLDPPPEQLARAAARLGADVVLVVPVRLDEAAVASLELLGQGFDGAARAAARVSSAQLALALRAFAPHESADGARARADTLRVAGEALSAGADPSAAASHVLRVAVDVSGASAAAVWAFDPSGEPELEASVGTFDARAAREAARETGLRPLGDGSELTIPLRGSQPRALQLLFAAGAEPDADELSRLEGFVLRATHALRAGERTLRLSAELEQTRALLSVVGQATEELSLSHALETAIDRVADLVRTDRLAVYLVDDGGLAAAAERGLAGPHVPVAEVLFELALGPFRGRGIVALPDAAAEPRLARVAESVSEAGIEAAVCVPLLVAGEAIGLLCAYPPRGRSTSVSESALLSALAGQLAVAVQNARLHEQATRLGAELEHALAAEREAARRLGALYEISSAFAESLSLDVTVQAVARTAVELLGVDAALVRMPDHRREQLQPIALHVAEKQLEDPLHAVLFRPQRLADAALRPLLRAREAIVLDAGRAAAMGAPHALLVPFLEKGSTAALVPLATPTEVLGSLTLLSLRPDEPIDDSTVATAIAIGGHAALAIANARLYQQQKDFAESMQRSLLPQVRPPVEGLDIGEVYAPSARAEVGGDLYDYIALADGRLAVVLGDVTGHGIDAAADMAMAKYVFRSLAREHPEPGEFLAAANDVIVGEIAPGKFITMLYLLVDPRTGELACASAGHPPPRLVAPDGTVGSIEARGLALGVDPGVEYEEVRARLESGGAVVLYTDGVIEARAGGELYGVERLDALLKRRRTVDAENTAGSVIHSARLFSGGELLDDCAVVVLKLR